MISAISFRSWNIFGRLSYRNLPTCPPKKNRPIFFGQKKGSPPDTSIHPPVTPWGGVAAALADRAIGETGKPCEPTDEPPSDRAGDGRVTGCTGNGVVWYEFIWIKGWMLVGGRIFFGYWDGWWIVESVSLYIMCCRWNGWLCWNPVAAEILDEGFFFWEWHHILRGYPFEKCFGSNHKSGSGTCQGFGF